MSDFNAELPNLAASTEVTPQFMQDRLKPDGIYDHLMDAMCADENLTAYLGSGNMTIGTDYIISNAITPTTDSGIEPSFTTAGDVSGDAFKTIVFGAVGNKASGTKMGPMGNFVLGGEKKFINDSSSLRNVIQLQCPPRLPRILRLAWANQLKEFDRLRSTVASAIGVTNVNDMLFPLSDNGSGIRVATRPIYVKKTPSPDSIDQRGDSDHVKLNQSLRDTLVDQAVTNSSNMNDCDVASGYTYPCDKFPGRHHEIFKNHDSEILQHEIYDLNDNIVAPWDIHKVLRPGVLVICEGIFTVWKPKKGTKNHIVQFIAESIRVIADSDSAEEIPDMPNDNYNKKKDAATTPVKRSRSFAAFGRKPTTLNDIQSESPAKRIRRDEPSAKAMGKRRA